MGRGELLASQVIAAPLIEEALNFRGGVVGFWHASYPDEIDEDTKVGVTRRLLKAGAVFLR